VIREKEMTLDWA